MSVCSLNIDVVVSNLIWTERAVVKSFRTAIGGAEHISDMGICTLAVQGECADLSDVLAIEGPSVDAHGEEAAAVLQT